MEVALIGAGVGFGVAVFLLLFDYIMSSRAAAERAARIKARTAQLDATEIKSLKALFRFCLLLPLLFAAGAWAIWG